MDSYDIKSLFDEITRSIREKRSRGIHRGIHWIPQEQLDEERKHENAMALEQKRSEGELDKQRLINAGGVETQKVRNVGELARQSLMNEGQANVETIRGGFDVRGQEIQAGAYKYGADRVLEGSKYGADQTLAGHKYTADKGLESHRLGAEATVEAAKIGKKTPSEIYLEQSGEFFNPDVYDRFRKREVEPPAVPEIKPNPTVDAPQAAPVAPSPVVASKPVSPARAAIAEPKPYNPNGLGWGDLEQRPSYKAFQERRKKERELAAERRKAEAIAWNKSLREGALNRKKRDMDSPLDQMGGMFR